MFNYRLTRAILTTVVVLSLSVTLSAEDLLLQISSVKEVDGNRWPSMSIVRFDSTSNESNPKFRSVLSDLFLTSGLAVGDRDIGFYGGANVIESIDMSLSDDDTRLGAVRTDLKNFAIDLESGYGGELIFVDGNRVRVMHGSTVRTASPPDYIDITQADINRAGEIVFFDKTKAEISRVDPIGSITRMGVFDDFALRGIRDLKFLPSGDIVAAAGWGFVKTELIPSSLVRIESQGNRSDLFTPATMFDWFDECQANKGDRFDASCTNKIQETIVTDIHVTEESDMFVSFVAPGTDNLGRDGHLVRLSDDGEILQNWTFPGSPILSIAGSRGPVAVPVMSTNGNSDLNGNSIVDVGDIELLTEAVRSLSNDIDRFDLNGDKVVDEIDRRYFVRVVRNTYFGDTNWDGVFDSSDLVMAFASGEFEDEITGNSIWRTGDWNGDGDFTTNDLVKAFQSGGYVEFELNAAAAVPEPNGMFTILVSVVGLTMWRRYHVRS